MSEAQMRQMKTADEGLSWFFIDSWLMVKRSIQHITRSTDQLLGAIIQPIMFTLLFRYVFGAAINTGPISYVNFLMAGILVQTAAFGASTTSISVANDLQRGVIDRFRSSPMSDSAVLVGHVVADLVRNSISIFIMIVVAFLVGFRPTATPFEWVMAIGILLLFTFALSWLSAILGVLAKSVEAVQWFSFLFIFPLTFASSAYVPTAGMPFLLRIFAENQPVTHVIETVRALMVGTELGNHLWWALFWCVIVIAITLPIATILFRNYNRN